MAGRAARRAVAAPGLVMANDREAALTAAALNVDIVTEFMRQLGERQCGQRESRELFRWSVGAGQRSRLTASVGTSPELKSRTQT